MSLFKSSYLKFITYRIIKIHFQLEASIYRIVKSYHRLSTFITKLISSINFSVTVPNSLAATTAIVWVEKREKERGREERKRGLKSKGRLWKVHFRLPGKVGQIYRIRKVGSFRRELLGNWKRTDRRLVTSTYPYAARTAPVYRVSYSRVSVCAPRGVPSTFLLFLLTSPRPSRFVLARRATRCFVTPNFRLYPDAALPEYILSLDAVKKGSWYTGGISVKSTWILVKRNLGGFFFFWILTSERVCKPLRDYLF